MTLKRMLYLYTFFGLGLQSVAAYGQEERWGGAGHRHITGGAIAHLPQPLRHFFEANATTIANQAGVEPPGTHYIDIDYYPEFFAGTLPHVYADLVALYGVSVVEDNGTAPWTVGTYTNSLSTMMASATTAQAWTNLTYTAAALAHYVEDLHNPLHLTMNYNGQLTGNYGIHSRYESTMISRHLADLQFTPAPEQCIYRPAIVETIFDTIDVNYWYVDDIMAADDLADAADPSHQTTYYDVLWDQTGDFTQVLFQDASEMVAGAWYTAWIDAGAPLPLPAPSALELFEWCITGPDQPVSPGCSTADSDGDDDVDLADWTVLQSS